MALSLKVNKIIKTKSMCVHYKQWIKYDKIMNKIG